MPFQPGNCANPSGRPKGSKGFRARFFEKLAEKNQDKIESGVNWLFELVESKDFNALRVMLEYFGCKARNDVDKDDEPEKKPIVAESAPDEAIRAYMLVREGKGKVVMIENENEKDMKDEE